MEMAFCPPKSVHMSAEQSSFLMPIGMSLSEHNRWVRLAKLVPWTAAEQVYESNFDRRRGGPTPYPARLALGALIIKERLGLTDRETVEQIRENPYLQYFIGKSAFTDDVPFDHTMLAVFRRRFGDDGINMVNTALIDGCLHDPDESDDDIDSDAPAPGGDNASGADASPTDKEVPSAGDDAPSGKLLIDATCAPADITYPTDLKLLDHGRRLTEQIIDILHEPYAGTRRKPRTYRRNARRDFVCAAKNKKLSRRKRRTAVGKQLRYLRRNLGHIVHFVAADGRCLARLDAELYRKLLVIHEVFRQQEAMYRAHARRIDDRIVSIAQPHVRPIVRGKAHANTEFGAKISVSSFRGFATLDRLSWDAYHEAGDLPKQAEAYRDRCGCYPEVICADRIYRTRANRRWCKERGIRLSGMPPGRPLADPAEQRQRERQVRDDENARQPIEGTFGCGKRRYGLARIMAKTATTSGCVIALTLLVMNLEVALVLLLALGAGVLLLALSPRLLERWGCPLPTGWWPSGFQSPQGWRSA